MTLGLNFPNSVLRTDVSITGDAEVNVRAGGGGNISINARNLNMAGGSNLLAGINSGLGSVGSQAGDIEVNAQGAINLEDNSIISNQVLRNAVGNGGDINITTDLLKATNGSSVTASTFGQGNAGNVAPGGIGTSDDINIKTGSLFLTNGAQLVASTFGQGNAGSVNITARDTVSLDGIGKNGFPSGVFSTVTPRGVGNSGDVNITTSLLSLTNGAQLQASNSRNGAAGNITVDADSIRLNNNSDVQSNTQGGGGSIAVRSGDLILGRGSSITTNARGTNNPGGNITIDTDVLAAFANSDITANSTDFRGVNVKINAQGIFGTQFREALTPDSDITATGANSLSSGTVDIITPNTDPMQDLNALPTNIIDTSQLIANSCIGRSKRPKGKFIITGNGGLPMMPDDPSIAPYQTRTSPFKVVKFGTKIGYFNLQKTQNLSRGFKMAALKQRIFVCHLERASPNDVSLGKGYTSLGYYNDKVSWYKVTGNRGWYAYTGKNYTGVRYYLAPYSKGNLYGYANNNWESARPA